jgi:hypothetical protein
MRCAQVIGSWEVTWEGESRDDRNENSNKWGDKAHVRMLAPLSSGANVAKTKSATGNACASATVAALWVHRARGHSAAKAQRACSACACNGCVFGVYSNTHRPGHGGPRRGTAVRRTRATACRVTEFRELMLFHPLLSLVHGKGGGEQDGGWEETSTRTFCAAIARRQPPA